MSLGKIVNDGVVWGLALWAFGFVLGVVFYPFVPTAYLGWVITPFGLAATALVLWRYVRVADIGRAMVVGILWCGIAVVMDYVMIVKLLNPADGYYKPDVFVYYASALLLPVIAAVLRRG